MVGEVLIALQPRPGGRYVDGTIGGGGHAEALLRASVPDGRLFGCDRDSAAIEAAGRRLADYADRCEVRHGSFADLPTWVSPLSCDGVLLDLGVSSAQLDQAERGFSFQQAGPLDMRMDDRQALTAADLVNTMDERGLARLFRELGEEREGRRLARAIVRERDRAAITTTSQLARLIERWAPRRGRKLHPATRVFQALRLAVNDEVGSLQRGLPAAWGLLKPGGRLAIITFHSIDARLVKEFGHELSRGYRVTGVRDVPEFRQPCRPELRLVNRKPVPPSAAEVAANPRARSAQLRVFEKI
jgi:16S rRNA (cytosine1402-N4)-methyltransferase